MPNVKLFIDEELWDTASQGLRTGLAELRDLVCSGLQVDTSACQLALIRTTGPKGQPPVNVELHIMPGAARTRECLTTLAEGIRHLVGERSGLAAAVRIATLDPATYVAVK